MATTISSTEANRNFAALLRRVKAGESVDITSYGETVAEIRPKASSDDDDRRERLVAWKKLRAHLETQEFKVIGSWTRAELYERD